MTDRDSLLIELNNCIASAGRTLNVEEYYFKGVSATIPNSNFKTLGTLTFDELHLLSANSLIQISSTSTSDVGLVVLVIGYDDVFATVQETVLTNGRNGVSLLNNYYRINSMRVVGGAAAENIGDLYLTIDASSLSSGAPSNQSDYLYNMDATNNVAYILNSCIPGGVGKQLYPSYCIYSVSNDTGNLSHFEFEMKQTNSNKWYREFVFYCNEKSNSMWTWRLDGLKPIPNIDPLIGYDIRIRGKRISGGQLSASAAISIKQRV